MVPRRSAVCGFLAWLWLAAGACGDPGEKVPDASVLLVVERDVPSFLPAYLSLSVFDADGAKHVDRRLPAEGALEPVSAERLGTVLVNLKDTKPPVRVLLRAYVDGERVADVAAPQTRAWVKRSVSSCATGAR